MSQIGRKINNRLIYTLKGSSGAKNAEFPKVFFFDTH